MPVELEALRICSDQSYLDGLRTFLMLGLAGTTVAFWVTAWGHKIEPKD